MSIASGWDKSTKREVPWTNAISGSPDAIAKVPAVGYANDPRGGADAGNPADHVHTVYRGPDRDHGGGFRTIVLFRRGVLAFFVYGFAKSGQENLRRDELETCRLLADAYLALDGAGLAAAQAAEAIVEVKCDDQAI